MAIRSVGRRSVYPTGNVVRRALLTLRGEGVRSFWFKLVDIDPKFSKCQRIFLIRLFQHFLVDGLHANRIQPVEELFIFCQFVRTAGGVGLFCLQCCQ